jgi:hypothetical protein
MCPRNQRGTALATNTEVEKASMEMHPFKHPELELCQAELCQVMTGFGVQVLEDDRFSE